MFTELLTRLQRTETLEAAKSLLASFERAVEAMTRSFGSVREASLLRLDHWISQNPIEAKAAGAATLVFEHNMVGVPLQRAVAQPAGQPYGHVSLPLMVKAERPRDVHVRLVIIFALAFLALGLNWVGLAATSRGDETRTYFYLLRLAAFVLIIGAIVDKNRAGPAE